MEVDLDGVGELNQKVSFPVVLYEARRDMVQYLADFAPGISIEDMLGEIASPDVKEVYTAVVSGKAVGEGAYREAITVHRPRLQVLFSGYFTDNSLDAAGRSRRVPMTAPPIGRDNTVDLNGGQQPTMQTIIRNTDPSSNAGIPSLSVAVGLAANDMPVGVCLDGTRGFGSQVAGHRQGAAGPGRLPCRGPQTTGDAYNKGRN